MNSRYQFAETRDGEVYATLVPQPWRIVRIDRLLDQNTRELQRREGVCGGSAEKWHRAYNRHPELRARRDALYRLRGNEQQFRDRMAWKACAAEQRRRRAEYARESRRRFEESKCPTCGFHTLAAAWS